MQLNVVRLSLLVAALCAACGSNAAKENAPDAIAAAPECGAYLAAYRGCLSQVGTAAIIDQRVAAAKDALASSAKDEDSRARLRKTCSAGLEALKACR